jgi:2-isopropylmalate synthase
MKQMPIDKYAAYPQVKMPNRSWPNRVITQSPVWCSVDLRDGNQALSTPMNLSEKIEFFQLLVGLGFKQIEVGFPASAEVEYEFTRKLIEDDMIPDDVCIQVLTQAREHLIERTFKAIEGAKQAILHLYNSTSTLQREVVFQMSPKEIKQIAVDGTRLVKAHAAKLTGTKITFEYSPESFTGTELEYALDVCESVMQVWQPTEENKAIINLPATVELSTPNIFADMIEWFSRHFKNRNGIILSIHNHNDRGTGVAATELGLMAGAERVEGTLFGFGERTGNVDIVTLALNLFSQGVDPKLDFQNINQVAEIYKRCTRMPIHPRHPYVGDMVYTAFSGSHQDAIKKGMDHFSSIKNDQWAVPYLPIDPRDVGRTYEKIIQINSQSGKGGVAYIMDHHFGFKLPKSMHPEVGLIIQKEADKTGDEIVPERIYQIFEDEYLRTETPFKFKECEINTKGNQTRVKLQLEVDKLTQIYAGSGNGPLDAVGNALKTSGMVQFKLISYSEHALDQSTSSEAAAYIQLKIGDTEIFGVGVDSNISIASIKALMCALNRADAQKISLDFAS